MRTRAAVIDKAPGSFSVAEVELADPRQGELLVRMVASGVCHSDDHILTGDWVVGIYPMIGGHEGAGVVAEVGPNTPGWEVGDHVVFSYIPSCGKCRWCASGMQNLCDLGATLLTGGRAEDPTTYRAALPDGTAVGQICGIGTFSEYSVVSQNSAVKVDRHLSLVSLCLLGCGVGTGWGSAVNSAAVAPGETVIVMGAGGVGMNAVQGAAHAGAGAVVVVDPVDFKREAAAKFGATHTFADIEEATEFVRGRTNGQGADSAIITVGVLKGEHIASAFAAIRKAGTVVVTSMGGLDDVGIPVAASELTLYQKRIQGSCFGACNPVADIPRQVQMFRDGQLLLDELITTRYSLDEVAQAYADMHAGKNVRGVVVFPDA